MSQKRRDNRNRILQQGESQRKDRRYAYKYIDAFGNPQFVYAWKLVPTDKTPTGKRDDLSLREKKRQIQKDLDDGIDPIGKKMTVCQLYAKQTRHRENVREGTKAAFYTAIQDDCIRKNPFDFQLNTVLEDDTEPKVPLTPTQEASFLSFVANDSVYDRLKKEKPTTCDCSQDCRLQ